MGSDFWDPLDVVVFTTWVVGPVLPGSAIARSAIPAVPSRHLFFSVQSKPRLRMLVWTSNPEVTPAPEVGVLLYPKLFGVCFFEEVEGQKVEVGGNTAAQYSF